MPVWAHREMLCEGRPEHKSKTGKKRLNERITSGRACPREGGALLLHIELDAFFAGFTYSQVRTLPSILLIQFARVHVRVETLVPAMNVDFEPLNVNKASVFWRICGVPTSRMGFATETTVCDTIAQSTLISMTLKSLFQSMRFTQKLEAWVSNELSQQHKKHSIALFLRSAPNNTQFQEQPSAQACHWWQQLIALCQYKTGKGMDSFGT